MAAYPTNGLQIPPTVAAAAQVQGCEAGLDAFFQFLADEDEASQLELSRLGNRTSQGDHLHDSLSAHVNDFASRLEITHADLQRQRAASESLHRALEEQKEHERAALASVAEEHDEKVRKMRSAHEEGMQRQESGLDRQLKRVDRLVKEKEALTVRCEQLAADLKAAERSLQQKSEQMSAQAANELARQKQSWSAAEKLRRESWEESKVKEIKERTVKGLQPEVERLIQDRKQAVLRLEERHAAELQKQQSELSAAAEARLQELREQLLLEHQSALDSEREAHRAQLRDEFERFTRELQEERSKFASEVAAEQQKVQRECQEKIAALEEQFQGKLQSQRTGAQAELQGLLEKLRESEQRHQQELRTVREGKSAELEQCMVDVLRKQQLEAKQREAALMEDFARDMNRQREELLRSFQQKQQEEQLAAEQQHKAALSAAKTEADRAEKALRVQLATFSADLSAARGRQQELQELLNKASRQSGEDGLKIRQLSQVLEDAKKQAVGHAEGVSQLQSEHHEAINEVKTEHKQELDKLRTEIERLDACLDDERGRRQDQLKDAKRRQEELSSSFTRRQEQLEADWEDRLKRALRSKDDALEDLSSRYQMLESRLRAAERRAT
eukprot:TRINITY_DN122005_c0_g1_i1.p1 TRINITY_DN122005_c0_g1~~TRINITY_DN122005_c0_g1_i1.p1  ORF type:complete len:618 (-),score=237.80 TRINITY_DN122005_c0_g1_i1:137-1990(-)